MVDTISVLNPTAKPRRLENTLSSRGENLEGKRLGFLWNNKPNGKVIFRTLENILVPKLGYKMSNTTVNGLLQYQQMRTL